MSMPAEKLHDRFTYGQYLTWPDDERWELIHGEAYDMSPAPSPVHQQVLVELVAEIRNFFETARFFLSCVCGTFRYPPS